MKKLLENTVDAQIGNKAVVEIKYNNDVLWQKDAYYVTYSIDPGESVSAKVSLNDKEYDLSAKKYIYSYLPSLDAYGTRSEKYYEQVKVNGNIYEDLSTEHYSTYFKEITVNFPSNTKKISFSFGNRESSDSDAYSRVKEIKSIRTSNITDMSYMFCDCIGLNIVNLSDLITTNVTNMRYMFNECNKLISLDLSSFSTNRVTDMCGMFRFCKSLTSLDVSNFSTSNVTSMSSMFYYCKSLTSLDLSNFDTSNVTSMSNMFSGCTSLTSLDLSNFDTSNVTSMRDMFNGCTSLTSLDLSNFDTSNVTEIGYMFANVPSNCKIYVSDKFTLTEEQTSFSGTFIHV